jgi:hypothetical protein
MDAMSGESADGELERLVLGLIPVAKTRVVNAAERSPETFAEELWTLASLYVIRENLTEKTVK